MKIEKSNGITTIVEDQFLPRFVRYFAVSSIACGVSLLVVAMFLIFSGDDGYFQIFIAVLLSLAAILYGVYLLFLFPDVSVLLDRKSGKAKITSRRMLDRSVRELELRRITRLLVDRSESSSGKNIYRIAFVTYKGEMIPLTGSWTDQITRLEKEAKEIHGSLDAAATLDFPKIFIAELEELAKDTSKAAQPSAEHPPLVVSELPLSDASEKANSKEKS